MRREGYLRRRLGRAWICNVDIDLESSAQVKEESVVADLQMSADGRIPDITETLFAFRAVRSDFISRARQQVGIVWIERLPRLALRHSGKASIDIAIRAFAVVR